MLNNLKGKCKVTPGVGVRVRLIEASGLGNEPRSVKTIGTAGLAATPVVPYTYKPGDAVTLGEAFSYVGGAKFIEFVVVSDSGDIAATSVGEKGFEAYENMYKGMIKGVGTAQREWAESITDACGGVVAMIENRDGDWDKMGSRTSPVTVSFKFQSGQKAGDKSGAEIEIKDASGQIYRMYPNALGMDVLPQ